MLVIPISLAPHIQRTSVTPAACYKRIYVQIFNPESLEWREEAALPENMTTYYPSLLTWNRKPILLGMYRL